ncbi:unnamed protein product [Dovyalis caffra]|uniref:Maturase K n=1 Tax=Dovyalis caffra TaxID=77055 RepID=A0AAV1S3H0_9ROSI|nr:unnamed protein product [Dovyalis caffra]
MNRGQKCVNIYVSLNMKFSNTPTSPLGLVPQEFVISNLTEKLAHGLRSWASSPKTRMGYTRNLLPLIRESFRSSSHTYLLTANNQNSLA